MAKKINFMKVDFYRACEEYPYRVHPVWGIYGEKCPMCDSFDWVDCVDFGYGSWSSYPGLGPKYYENRGAPVSRYYICNECGEVFS